ncbi:hypothetical protein DFJ74DRAFT_713700 [Hyaloraphidium curvatum]|nr:hypothetical protein DFJ74DRAFT_713700 [Hyaloraphidium curvatum]
MLSLDESSPGELAEAIASNFASHCSVLAARLPDAVVRTTRFCLVDTGLPCDTFNTVTLSKLTEDDAEEAVRSMIARFRDAKRPFAYWVSPVDTPADLPGILAEAGLRRAEHDVEMVLDLSTWDPPAVAPPAGFQVAHVESREDLEGYAAVVAANWDPPDPYVPDFYRRTWDATHGDASVRMFVGRASGRVVCSGELCLTNGLAGIFTIGTLREARGRGYASAVVVAMLVEAKAEGYRTAVPPGTSGTLRKMVQKPSYPVVHWPSKARLAVAPERVTRAPLCGVSGGLSYTLFLLASGKVAGPVRASAAVELVGGWTAVEVVRVPDAVELVCVSDIVELLCVVCEVVELVAVALLVELLRDSVEVVAVKLDVELVRLLELEVAVRLAEVVELVTLRLDVERVKLEVDGVKLDVDGVKLDVEGVKLEVEGVKLEVEGVKLEVDGVKLEVEGAAVRLVELRVSELDVRVRLVVAAAAVVVGAGGGSAQAPGTVNVVHWQY